MDALIAKFMRICYSWYLKHVRIWVFSMRHIRRYARYLELWLLITNGSDLNIDLKGRAISDTGVKTLFADMFDIPNDVKFDSDFTLQASDGLDLTPWL